MKRYIMCFGAASMLFSSVCVAENDYYISTQMGMSYLNKKVSFAPADRVGPEVTKEKFKKSNVYDLTLGRKIFDNSFLELEASYAPSHKFNKSAIIDSGYFLQADNFSTKLQTTSFFVNGMQQFKDYLPMSITPYVTAGVGVSINKIKNVRETAPTSESLSFNIKGKRTSNFAWQVGAGFLVPVTKNIDVKLSYKFRSLGNVKTTGHYVSTNGSTILDRNPLIKGKLYSSDIMLGVAFNF
jgi:opacity protein-like surface antigen